MTSNIVPIGTYTIRSKRTAKPEDFIISPGAQTCVIVVLESPAGIAVAHIDTPLVAARVTLTMIEELEGMGPGQVTARMYGGDYGNPLFNSTTISTPIYAELNRRKIPYTHTDYRLTAGFAMATAAAVWACSALGPESRLMALVSIGLAYKATNIIKIALPRKWHPGFLGNNIDVCVNVMTGQVQLEKDNEQNSEMLLYQAKDKLGNTLWNRITTRASLNPEDQKNKSGLAMLRV